MKYYRVFLRDRTDGTAWHIQVYASSAQDARLQTIDRIAPHVTIISVKERDA